ncbi:unnamed protein product [Schistocephalus solidus]|uniref:Uncharacterized protein n=1 Tax=Schistocephalus solidus TaxID=70667 RepID=A0A3P7BWU5_SCHSO|nr:unnamed protein product [Schistocephalus solidus]
MILFLVLMTSGLKGPMNPLAYGNQKHRSTYLKTDATAAANNVHKLTRLLDADSSSENQYNACAVLHKLAQKQASRNGLAVFPQVLESLVRLLQTTHDIDTQTEASLALRQLCNAKPAASAVGQYLPIPTLVQLLRYATSHSLPSSFVHWLAVLSF